MQQALENSGLPGSVEEDQEGDPKETSSGVAGAVSVTNSGDAPRLGTMAVHDSATGVLKRHYIRKV